MIPKDMIQMNMEVIYNSHPFFLEKKAGTEKNYFVLKFIFYKRTFTPFYISNANFKNIIKMIINNIQE